MLNFGKYAGAAIEEVPQQYLDAVAPVLKEQFEMLQFERDRRAGTLKVRELSKEPDYYRMFTKACKVGTGREFLDGLKLKGQQWEYWFQYIISRKCSWRSTSAVPAEIALEFFHSIGVSGF
jgi:hypothetical protein